MNEFGDERKQTLDGVLEPETAAILSLILRDVEPIVLGITFWKCFRPWRVPERRICDNFFFMTLFGEEVVSVGDETRLFRRGDAMIVPEFVPHAFGLADGCDASSHFIAHALADNVGLNVHMLRASGIPAEHIFISKQDTCAGGEAFFSYRRDRCKGRHFSFLYKK